jgi:hypothetical protein
MGSSVGGTAGALSLGGREITAEVPGWMSQLGANTAYLINAVQKVAVGGQALTTNSNTGKKTEALWTQLFTSTAKNFADLGFTFFKFKKLREKFQSYKTQADPKTAIEQAVKNVEEKGTARDKLAADADASAEDRAAAVDELDKAIRDLDNLTNAVLAVQDANRTALDVSPGMLFLGSANIPPFEKVAIVMNLVLSIANAAFKITEKIMEEKLKGDVLDRFNYASMVVTNGIILTATSIQLGLTAAAKEGGTAGLCLGFDGSIVARAARNQTFYAITEQKGAAPGPMIADWVFWFTAAATGATKLTNTSIAFTNALQALQKVDDTENPEVL